MTTADTGGEAIGARAGDARSRILDAATAMFYADGIRSTSADRIIDQAGITKVTFYRHFRTKSALVVAYLRVQASREREALAAAAGESIAADDAVRGVAEMIGTVACSPGFRGCPFINSAAEFPDESDPVRAVIAEHRAWTLELFAGIARRAGAASPADVAEQFMMLRDGAMVSGYLDDPQRVVETLQRSLRAAAFTSNT